MNIGNLEEQEDLLKELQEFPEKTIVLLEKQLRQDFTRIESELDNVIEQHTIVREGHPNCVGKLVAEARIFQDYLRTNPSEVLLGKERFLNILSPDSRAIFLRLTENPFF